MNTNTQTMDYYDAIPEFWNDCDRVEIWLKTQSGFHNPSTIKRGAKCQGDIYHVLEYMDRYTYINAQGNGRWRKYAAR